jgi:hypothetical protein
MAISRWLATVSSFVLSTVFTLNGAAAQNASKIGVASAVKNRVDGQIGGTTRPLVAGGDIFARETVRTGEQSTAQLLFLDETSLSVGPQSEVTLDRFVYDPNRGRGQVVVNATRGALRFVSGSQQSSSYQIRTPVATIGVRGTAFDVYSVFDQVRKQWTTIIILIEGSLNAGGHTLNKPGQALIFTPGGVQQVTWDSTLISVVSGVPFPLLGTQFLASDPRWQIFQGVPGDRIEQLLGTGPTFVPDIGYGN